MTRILIVEDEADIQELLDAYLRDAGYDTALAGDGIEAAALFQRERFDLVLLDVMLPKLDGFAVCKILRQESRTPILMLTALDDDDNQLKGFDALADDYIAKPFSMPVVLKRIEAVLRRAGGDDPANRVLRHGAVALDADGQCVQVHGQPVELTAREFAILRILLENQGRVISRQRLLDSVWGRYEPVDDRVVSTHIKNLRKKLGADCIETIRGAGYKIEKED